ncbi:19634_t:CDS:2 [Dentiscutata erythropus]|uniref:19634_t:CDS:1 n=1 Tax=Dentiscutata erythropus TaxID=1348616 RepID=A0A9N9ECF5_9GLOM|nr:19634_t:CDS:2 [Dentiscutata erythropus]
MLLSCQISCKETTDKNKSELDEIIANETYLKEFRTADNSLNPDDYRPMPIVEEILR